MKKTLIISLALSLTVQGVSAFNVLATDENPLNINFGEQLTVQENDGYAALSGNTYERYMQSKNELPNEVPVMERVQVTGKNVFYVDCNGDDSNDGRSVGEPFESIEKALSAVAALSDGDKAKGSVIYVRGGEYFISQKAEITAEHCSTSAALFISAYNGEDVTFTSSESFKQKNMKKITQSSVGFASYVRLPYETRENGYYIDYSDMGIDYISTENELLSDDIEMTLARYPNVGYDSVKEVINGGYGKSSVWKPMLDRAFDWLDTGNIRVYGKFSYNWEFLDSVVRMDKSAQTLHGTGTLSHSDWPLSKYLKGGGASMYYYYNIMEELDVPGEWFADNTTKRLYVYPLSENNENLYQITGTKDIFGLSNAKNIVFDGINISNTKNAVYAENTENVIIQNCTFENISGAAVNFVNTKKCGVINSTLSGIGADTRLIKISESTEERLKLEPKRNFVQNNILTDSKASIDLSGTGNIVSHNLIKNTSNSPLVFTGAECIIEYNEFSGTQKLVADSGAVYTGTNFYIKNNHVRYNYFHDSKYGQRNGRAIYFDDCGDGNFAYGNIVRNYGYGVQIHGGDSNVIDGNTIINASMPVENGYDYAMNSISDNQMQWAFFVDCAIFKGYTENGYDKAEAWQTRYNTQLTDKYAQVMEAKEEFASLGTESEAVKKVKAVTYYKLTHSSTSYENISGYSDVKKCVAVAVDSDCWYTNNTIIDCAKDPVYGTVVGMDNHASENRKLTTDADDYITDYIDYFDNIGVNTDSVSISKPIIHLTDGGKLKPEDFRGFSWDKSDMSSYYNVKVATDENFDNIVVDYNTDDNEFALYKYSCASEESEVIINSQYTYNDVQTGDTDFVADKQYYVKVSAINNDNSLNCGSVESDACKFMLSEDTTPNNEWGMLRGNVSGFIQIEGKIPEGKTDKNVNIIIYDKSVAKNQLEDNISAIKQLAQTEADENGKFSYKFKIDVSDLSTLNAAVRVGDDELADNAFTQTVQSFTEFELEVSNDKDVNGADIVKAASIANNKFGAVGSYSVIIAEYDGEDNTLKGCKYEEFEVTDVNNADTVYTIKSSSSKIKVFAWSNMIPLTDVE